MPSKQTSLTDPAPSNLPAVKSSAEMAMEVMAAAGVDMKEELQQQSAGLPSMIPIIKLDPKKSGYLVYTLGCDPDTGDEMSVQMIKVGGIIADHIQKRALFYGSKDPKCKQMWVDFPAVGHLKPSMESVLKEGFPICASVGLVPTTQFKFAANCAVCPLNAIGSPCRPKTNLLLSHFIGEDTNGKPISGQAVLLLPPTSIKHFSGKRGYLSGLKAQNFPLIATWTDFFTESQSGSGYEWHECKMHKGKLATTEQVKEAVAFRKAAEAEFRRFVLAEFNDPGDQPVTESNDQPY